jgi:AraC-like DNA-binding protein
MQIQPPQELAPFIKHYIFLDYKGKDVKSLRLFSDGNTGIVFSYNNTISTDIKKNKKSGLLPNSFLYGQINEYKDLTIANDITMTIVVFQPSGINQLIGIPANEIKNDIISIEYIFGVMASELKEKLIEKITIQDKISLLNNFFIGLLRNRKSRNDLIIQESLNYIVNKKGIISLDQLVKLTGYTERHIERKFNESIGISPKKFASITKLHNFIKNCNNGLVEKKLTTTAYEAGYADQSHLIKDFRKITGMTPTIYMDKSDKLAINFVKFHPISILSKK